MRHGGLSAAVAAALLLVGCGDSEDRPPAEPTPTAASASLRLVRVASGLEAPLQTVAVPGGDDLLYVIEQAGRIRVVEAGRLRREPLLDISSRVRSGGEQGLLSLALHPSFPSDPRVYIHYSDPNGDTRVEELRVVDGRVSGEPRVLLEVAQPYPNHNGGSLAFGPDGLLYLGLGDGGAAFDPEGNGQNLESRLGKLLRADVDRAPARWQTAAYGLRNPWRFAFDSGTGDLWIGDVGQDEWEEVNVYREGTSGLVNFGWDVFEGPERAERSDRGDLTEEGELVDPVVSYRHEEGCSITGGVVYRGDETPSIAGRYIYGDFCSGTIWSIPADGSRPAARRESITVESLVSFDRDARGEVLVTSQSGTVSRVVAG